MQMNLTTIFDWCLALEQPSYGESCDKVDHFVMHRYLLQKKHRNVITRGERVHVGEWVRLVPTSWRVWDFSWMFLEGQERSFHLFHTFRLPLPSVFCPSPSFRNDSAGGEGTYSLSSTSSLIELCLLSLLFSIISATVSPRLQFPSFSFKSNPIFRLGKSRESSKT